jgi:dihydrofolate reductase
VKIGGQEQKVIVSIIVAAAENGVIGRNGQMPWRIPSDLKTFRRLTLGKPVIMGRKTYASIGKPLDGRLNIVVSRDAHFAAPGAVVVPSLAAAIEHARAHAATAPEIMVIGGAEIYAAALPLANRIYLTCVHAQPGGDARFQVPQGDGWTQVSSMPLPRSDQDEFACTLIVLERTAGA